MSTDRPQPGLMTELARDGSGAVAVMWALLTPAVFGFVGLGVEAGMWYMDVRDLQSMADAGAYAGAYEIARGTTDDAEAEAERATVTNGYTGTDMTRAVNVGADTVEVVITKTATRLLTSMFLSTDPVITARATAKAEANADDNACILSLDPTASSATRVGGNVTLNMQGCSVVSNSMADDAVDVFGSADVTAQSVAAVGKVNADSDHVTGAIRSGILPLADPFASLAEPAVPAGACDADHTDVTVKPSATTTLTPGKYCGDMSLKGTVSLDPGIYYIDGGSLTINSQAVITGSEVTIFLSGSPASTLTVNGGATVILSPPTSGATQGMTFWQTSSASTGGVNNVNGGATMNITGIVYFPNQEISFSGGDAANAPCTRVVARIVSFSGNADMDNANCVAAGVPDIPLPASVTLIE